MTDQAYDPNQNIEQAICPNNKIIAKTPVIDSLSHK
jgi:hypothetical protein